MKMRYAILVALFTLPTITQTTNHHKKPTNRILAENYFKNLHLQELYVRAQTNAKNIYLARCEEYEEKLRHAKTYIITGAILTAGSSIDLINKLRKTKKTLTKFLSKNITPITIFTTGVGLALYGLLFYRKTEAQQDLNF